MKPMHEINRRFVLLCICPPDKPLNRRTKLFNISFVILNLIIMMYLLFGSMFFCARNFSTDLVHTICAVLQICVAFLGLNSLFTAFIKRSNNKNIFDAYQTFYNASKSTQSLISEMIFFFIKIKIYDFDCLTDKYRDPRGYMDKADQEARHALKLFDIWFLFSCPMSILINSIGSYLFNKWKYEHIDPQNLYRAYRFVYEN